jgi:hypothetical protein
MIKRRLMGAIGVVGLGIGLRGLGIRGSTTSWTVGS